MPVYLHAGDRLGVDPNGDRLYIANEGRNPAMGFGDGNPLWIRALSLDEPRHIDWFGVPTWCTGRFRMIGGRTPAIIMPTGAMVSWTDGRSQGGDSQPK